LGGRRADFLAVGRRSVAAGEAGPEEVLDEGEAGGEAGVGAGAGSEGSGSIQPEPDQPISI
jgi:hypothetical protein